MSDTSHAIPLSTTITQATVGITAPAEPPARPIISVMSTVSLQPFNGTTNVERVNSYVNGSLVSDDGAPFAQAVRSRYQSAIEASEGPETS
jgi:hypothetical protein